MSHERKCGACGSTFSFWRENQRFCSQECRKKYHNQKLTEWYKERSGVSPRPGQTPASIAWIPQLRKFIGPPKKTHLYFLIKAGVVAYIGTSSKLASRIESHAAKKDFDEVYYVEIPEHLAFEIETAFICAFDPPHNKTNENESHIHIEKYHADGSRCTIDCPAIKKLIHEQSIAG